VAPGYDAGNAAATNRARRHLEERLQQCQSDQNKCQLNGELSLLNDVQDTASRSVDTRHQEMLEMPAQVSSVSGVGLRTLITMTSADVVEEVRATKMMRESEDTRLTR